MSECPHGEELGPGFACPPCQPAPQPAPETGWSAPFPARFPGRCLACDGDIVPGDRIRWRAGEAVHDGCEEDADG